MGGEGGGEMKNSLSDLGNGRCWSLGLRGVVSPKYTRMRQPMSCSPSSFWRIVMAESTSKKDTTIRLKDFSGAHVCTAPYWLIVSRIWTRLEGLKISGSNRLVIMRVFDGGEGSTSGGRSEKSSESDDLFLDDDRECWGEASVVDMLGNMP